MHYPPPPPAHHFCIDDLLTQLLASILKFPPDRPQKETPYKDLVCTEQDKAIIYEIITTMARNSKLGLFMKSNHLRNLGAQINHVHALKFLATIFSNPELKACMPDIFDDHFKKGGLMDGLAPSLTRESEKGKLMMYLEDFSKEVGQHPHNTPHIRNYFQSQEWENLVKFLMKS